MSSLEILLLCKFLKHMWWTLVLTIWYVACVLRVSVTSIEILGVLICKIPDPFTRWRLFNNLAELVPYIYADDLVQCCAADYLAPIVDRPSAMLIIKFKCSSTEYKRYRSSCSQHTTSSEWSTGNIFLHVHSRQTHPISRRIWSVSRAHCGFLEWNPVGKYLASSLTHWGRDKMAAI